MIAGFTFYISAPVLSTLKKHSNISVKSFNGAVNHVGRLDISGNTAWLSVVTTARETSRLLFVDTLGAKDDIRAPIIFSAKPKNSEEGFKLYSDLGQAGVQQSARFPAFHKVYSKFPTLPDSRSRSRAGINATNVQAAIDRVPAADIFFDFTMTVLAARNQDKELDKHAQFILNNFSDMRNADRITALQYLDAKISDAKLITQSASTRAGLDAWARRARELSQYLAAL